MELPNILRLPNEILFLVCKYLRGNDLISFSIACQRFSSICHAMRSISLQNSWSISVVNLKSFLRCVDPLRLTVCNFNNCYWIPDKLITQFVKKCPNLKTLCVSSTRLNCGHLSSIFAKCPEIRELSLTLQRDDLWKNENIQRSNSKAATSEGWKVAMSKLSKLEIISLSPIPEIVLLVSFCVNLEELTVIISTVEDKNELRLLRSTPTFKQLKSLIVLNLESKDIDESLLYDQVIQMDIFCSQYFFLKFNSNRCNTYWNDFSPFPSIQNRTDVTLKIDKSSELDQSETFDMSDAVSVKDPTFMQRRTTTAKAVRVLDCFYYEKMFSEFCVRHREVSALRLRAAPSDGDGGDPLTVQCEPLSQLRALSLEPSLLAGTAAEETLSIGKPLLGLLLDNCCLRLEELEIISFRDSHASVNVTDADLSFIARCRCLKRLTLAHFHIQNGHFLEQIFAGCTNLENVRLNDLGAPGLCCYTRNLCAALPTASNLKVFSLRQKNVVPLGMLLDSLERCASLEHLALVVPSYSDPLKLSSKSFTHRFLRLTVGCSRLVAFFCVLNSPKTHCLSATRSIVDVIQLKRPAFQADFQSMSTSMSTSMLNFHVQSKLLSPIHRQVLVQFNSRVANRPHRSKPSIFLD